MEGVSRDRFGRQTEKAAMRKSLFIALAWTFVSFIGGVLPVYAYTDEEIAEFVRQKEIQNAIEDYLHRDIYPPRTYISSTLARISYGLGDLEQNIEVNLKDGECKVKLAFAEGPIPWKLASEFLMNTVEEILKISSKKDFYPDNITIMLFSNGTDLEGSGKYTRSDNMIRVTPPEPKSRKKAK